MDNAVSIINTESNELTFDVTVQGVTTAETQVTFVIELPDMTYGFRCSNTTGDSWSVTIPPLPTLTAENYPFHLDVVIDGYFFKPYTGTITLVSRPSVVSGSIESSTDNIDTNTPDNATDHHTFSFGQQKNESTRRTNADDTIRNHLTEISASSRERSGVARNMKKRKFERLSKLDIASTVERAITKTNATKKMSILDAAITKLTAPKVVSKKDQKILDIISN